MSASFSSSDVFQCKSRLAAGDPSGLTHLPSRAAMLREHPPGEQWAVPDGRNPRDRTEMAGRNHRDGADGRID